MRQSPVVLKRGTPVGKVSEYEADGCFYTGTEDVDLAASLLLGPTVGLIRAALAVSAAAAVGHVGPSATSSEGVSPTAVIPTGISATLTEGTPPVTASNWCSPLAESGFGIDSQTYAGVPSADKVSETALSNGITVYSGCFQNLAR